MYPKLLILCGLFDRVIDKQSQPFLAFGDSRQKARFEVEKRLFWVGYFTATAPDG
ncbi:MULTISPECIES: hypothetical protein [unclassified Microcoleus]|uniref:hypothetical protein n=1 Tax=unclassified Microcoleus TaxID=2642155 RepID=UPI002FCFA548